MSPVDLLFISGVEAELEAAQAAGVQALLIVRPGHPSGGSGRFPIVHHFEPVTESGKLSTRGFARKGITAEGVM